MRKLLLVTGFVLAASAAAARAEEINVIFSYELPNAPGFSITGVLVTFPPGDRSAKHHHPGSVTAYILSGAIRSENSATGPARLYYAGGSFFEPPGSEHLLSENASQTAPASLLAIIVAPDGARLKVDDK
jgi:quercetin dioxygenase-like cupin family protein